MKVRQTREKPGGGSCCLHRPLFAVAGGVTEDCEDAAVSSVCWGVNGQRNPGFLDFQRISLRNKQRVPL